MKPLSFTYNGKNSWDDFKLLISFDVELASSEPDVTAAEVPGRDGDVLIDNHRNKSVTQTFSLASAQPHPQGTEMMRQAIEWLRADVGIHDFELSSEPDYIRHASVLAAVSTTVKQDGVYGSVTFSFEPRRYLKEGLTDTAITSGTTLKNLGTIPSQPKITLVGTGDCQLTIGDSTYKFKGIDSGVVIDSQATSIVRSDGKDYAFGWYYETVFPLINPGQSPISWTGSFTGSITPRWAVRL